MVSLVDQIITGFLLNYIIVAYAYGKGGGGGGIVVGSVSLRNPPILRDSSKDGAMW